MQHSQNSPVSRSLATVCLAAVLGIMAATVTAANDPAERAASQKGLERLNSLIGEWRGVGQPKRGSNQGAWRQTGEWVWDFEGETVAINYRVTDGKLARAGRLTHNPATETYQLVVTTIDETERVYEGQLTDGKLVLESPADAGGTVSRITVTLLNDNRTLVLHEQRNATEARFHRVAEVGYTRSGVRLARSGAGQPECIVTGGAGTIEVSYQGKTYYVCCSGCRQAFEDDPEAVLAEAAERRRRQATADR